MNRFFLPLFIAIALSLFTFYRTDGFYLSRIQGPLSQGTAPLPDLECRDYLHQPFYYLAKGRQCFVFTSADDQIVIKFLNYSRFSFPGWLADFPLPHYWKMWLVSLNEDKRHLRFESTMKSFQLAMEQLRRTNRAHLSPYSTGRQSAGYRDCRSGASKAPDGFKQHGVYCAEKGCTYL